MHHRRIIAAAAGAAIAAGALTGCSAADQGGSELKILVWDNGPASVEAYESLAERFEAANEGVDVTLETANTNDYDTLIRTRLGGGAGPDLYGVRPSMTADLVTGGYLAPLSDEAWFQRLNAGAQDAPNAVVDGVAYATPISQAGEGMLYNPALFEQAGIAAPPTSFDELIEASEALDAAGITPLGMAAADNWWPQFVLYHLTAKLVDQDANAAIMSGEATFSDDEGWQTVLERYEELVPFFMPDPLGTRQEAAQAAFLQERVAMWPTVGLLPDVRDAGLEVGYFDFPAAAGGEDRLWGGYPVQLGINPKNGRTELATEFMAMMFDDEVYPEFVQQLQSYPVVDGVEIEGVDELSGELQADWEGRTLVASPPDTWLPGVQDAMLARVQELTAGRIDADAVLAAMDEATTAALDR
jgi:raffinose/stachyose/melibiose transport system substrate-binding protein